MNECHLHLPNARDNKYIKETSNKKYEFCLQTRKAYSRCMWENIRRMVIFLLSTFQRPIFALYKPLRDAFCWQEMVLANQIRKPVVSYISLGMSIMT